MPNRSKGRFNGIGRPQTWPMGSRKRIEHQRLLSIFLQAGHGLGIFELIGVEKDVYSLLRQPFGLRLPNFL